MGKIKVILACALLALLVSSAWQIAVCVLANYELQDDLKDIASLSTARIGLAHPSSDNDLREAVIDKAHGHDITLDPSQITVQRSGSEAIPVVYLAVDYKAHVTLPGLTLTLHFRPTSPKRR
ncbi:MAG TPA: hypothetical protein VEH47_05735 [Candidatus Acidoferrales bacterium]|nr:hypothetical protein [Candidatus Acidoferrales bacterium]